MTVKEETSFNFRPTSLTQPTVGNQNNSVAENSTHDPPVARLLIWLWPSFLPLNRPHFSSLQGEIENQTLLLLLKQNGNI